MVMGHRARHAVIFVVVRQIVTLHQHGYGDSVGNGNGNGYGKPRGGDDNDTTISLKIGGVGQWLGQW
jgi:hypothetical protein